METVYIFKSGSSIVSAFMLRLFLSKHITNLQWLAIVLQLCGLVIVQYDDCKHTSLADSKTYALILTSLSMTCFCGIWNEYLLKKYNEVDLFTQNIIMYTCGLLFNFLLFTLQDARLLQEFNAKVWSLVFCQAVTGVLVGAVLKHADAVVRTSANACTTGALYFLNIYFLHFAFKISVCMGCIVVFLSTYIYMTPNLERASEKLSNAAVGESNNSLRDEEI